jgi:hypothetical protein
MVFCMHDIRFADPFLSSDEHKINQDLRSLSGQANFQYQNLKMYESM